MSPKAKVKKDVQRITATMSGSFSALDSFKIICELKVKITQSMESEFKL